MVRGDIWRCAGDQGMGSSMVAHSMILHVARGIRPLPSSS